MEKEYKTNGENVKGLVGRVASEIKSIFRGIYLFPLKEGSICKPCDLWKYEVENMLNNAQTIEDLNNLGAKMNYAKDNNLDVGLIDYQFKAAKKMTEVYNKLKSEVEIA